MRSAKELMGKPIYSINNGRLLGSVKDVYVDSDMLAITGLYLGSEGLFSRRARLIPIDQITILGRDAMLAVGSDVVRDDREYAPSQEWLRRDSVQGRIMHTPGGTKVGSVGDLLLDHNSNVVGFSLARVHVEGPIARNRIVARAAIQDAGGFDGTMVVDLTEAEQSALGSTVTAESVDFEPNMQPVAGEDAADQEAEEDAPDGAPSGMPD